MIPLTVSQIAQDAGGTLLRGSPEALVTSVSTDSRTLPPQCLFVALSGENFDGHGFVGLAAAHGASAVLVSREISTGLEADFPVILVEDTLLGLQRLAAAHRQRWGGFVLGITGSNGKTSTKDLCYAVLSQARKCQATVGNLNNHIGLPLTCLSVTAADEVGIFEMGMNHPGEIAPLAAISMPNVAIITNIGTAHIEYMGSREAIALEKGMLVEALGWDGIAILSSEEDFAQSLEDRHCGRTLRAGFSENADICISEAQTTSTGSTFWLTFPDGQETQVSLALPGRHMVTNAALAAAAGWYLGMPAEQIKAGLESAKLNKGRLQIRQVRAVTFIDDTYNANPDSMLAGLETLRDFACSGRRLAVLGRMGELGSHSESGHQKVGQAAAEAGISALCVVGNDDARIIGQAAAEAGQQVSFFPDHAACATYLDSLSLTSDDVVFVKGSRSAAMEKVIDAFSQLPT